MKHWLLALPVICLALLLAACTGTPQDGPAEGGAADDGLSGIAGAENSPAEDEPAESVPQRGSTDGGRKFDGPFRSFAAVDLDGNPVDESILSGYDLTMINVWATFCGPCLGEMPELGELAAEYKDKGVQIVGLVTDVMGTDGVPVPSQAELAKQIVEQTGADYPHIVPSAELIETALRDVTGVPTTFFVDENGSLVGNAVLGARDKETWESILGERLLEVQ